MKKYVFEVIVNEQSDEFWEEITADGKSGCDEILKCVKDSLEENNFDITIRLTGYTDK